MDFTTVIESRYSVRSYKRRPVGKKKLQKVLEAIGFPEAQLVSVRCLEGGA